jgi:hypothetical protein
MFLNREAAALYPSLEGSLHSAFLQPAGSLRGFIHNLHRQQQFSLGRPLPLCGIARPLIRQGGKNLHLVMCTRPDFDNLAVA